MTLLRIKIRALADRAPAIITAEIHGSGHWNRGHSEENHWSGGKGVHWYGSHRNGDRWRDNHWNYDRIGGRWRVDYWIGYGGWYRPWYPRFGWYGRPYNPHPYYYPPSVVIVPEKPPVYIERIPPARRQPLPAGYWYYCDNPQGYYPYVKACPGGWRQVDPMPPSLR